MTEAALMGLATDTVKALVNLVAARALNEANLAWGFEDQLLKLNRKLAYIHAFLEDASDSKHVHKSKLVNLWLQKVKDVTYMAEDVIDEYAVEIFKAEMELKNHQHTGKLRNFFSKSNPMVFPLWMVHKVNKILSSFDELDKEAKDIGLNQVVIATTSSFSDLKVDQNLREAREFAAADETEFVGRKEDEEKLIEMLCSPPIDGQACTIVAIVGMGGLGKTTLARRLYDHPKIDTYFGNKKHWICVAEDFNITRILNEMIESTTLSKGELSNPDAIIRKLEQQMKGTKFLLVIDDLWNENEESWGSLMSSLQRTRALKGSALLITTRSEDVSKAVAASMHKLEGLYEAESWSLFMQKVGINRNSYPLEEIGRRIIEKCQGIPLAIKVIGGLLQSKPLHEWVSIEKSDIWDLPRGRNQILPSLMLSYNHLPSSSLKQCFAYFAIYSKSTLLFKNELIGVWISQGYLTETTNMTMEEVGDAYLKILISKSLIQENYIETIDMVRYSMHDLVHDLAVHVSGNDMIREPKKLGELGKCRNWVVEASALSTTLSGFPTKQDLSKLRTINWYGESQVLWDMLVHARYLRTLLINEAGITEVSSSIGLLQHLRFLDLSHNPISTLPDSFSMLYQLQTLVIEGCKSMTRLPKVINKLVNLRHISTEATMFAWKGLVQLTSLRSLPCLALDDNEQGWTINELGDLNELMDQLGIMGLECVKDIEDARKANLSRKGKVSKLTLAWATERGEVEGGISDEDVLESLQPHPDISSLQLKNYNGEKFPAWVTRMVVVNPEQELNKLTTVKLLNCKRCETIPSLGKLPLLECLILSGFNTEAIGHEFYGSSDFNVKVVAFPFLRELEISGFHRLTTWLPPKQESFPRIETLRVVDCVLLEGVPALDIKSLKCLEIQRLEEAGYLEVLNYTTGLTSLVLIEVPEIANLPQSLEMYTKLQKVQICNLGKLLELPIRLESLLQLQSLILRGCEALTFPKHDILHSLPSLREVEIEGCSSLASMPFALERCTSLEEIWIYSCPLIEVSPACFTNLLNLVAMGMSFASRDNLKTLLAAVQHLPGLTTLLVRCYNADNMIDCFSDITPFLCLPALRDLSIGGNNNPNIKILPQKLELLTGITRLGIYNFPGLEEIPDWISNLTSLSSLDLCDCKSLRSLPCKHLPHLNELILDKCPLLAEKYNKDGPEWHNIQHFPYIEIDDQIIQDL